MYNYEKIMELNKELGITFSHVAMNPDDVTSMSDVYTFIKGNNVINIPITKLDDTLKPIKLDILLNKSVNNDTNSKINPENNHTNEYLTGNLLSLTDFKVTYIINIDINVKIIFKLVPIISPSLII